MPDKITWEIKRHLSVLSTNEKSGWTREANIVSWNGGPDKLDIRDWKPDHSKMAKGITLTKEEAVDLYGALQRLFERRP